MQELENIINDSDFHNDEESPTMGIGVILPDMNYLTSQGEDTNS